MLAILFQLKNISQVGSFSQIGVKVLFFQDWNRHLENLKFFCDPQGRKKIFSFTNPYVNWFYRGWWVMWPPLVIQEMFHPGKPDQSPQDVFGIWRPQELLHPQDPSFRELISTDFCEGCFPVLPKLFRKKMCFFVSSLCKDLLQLEDILSLTTFCAYEIDKILRMMESTNQRITLLHFRWCLLKRSKVSKVSWIRFHFRFSSTLRLGSRVRYLENPHLLQQKTQLLQSTPKTWYH